jgi:hypothetical protein
MQKSLALLEEVLISGKPYIDSGDIRLFNVADDSKEYVWHRDKEDRLIEVLEGDGWQFQPENSLPYLLKPGTKLKILKDEYHRLIKGINNLKIKITKVL